MRRAEHDVADGVNAGLGGLHPGIGLDEFALGLDFRAFQADVLCARLAADRDQDFFGFDLLLLAIHRDRDRDSRFRLFDFVDFRAGMEVDAALAVHARQFLGNFFVLHRNQARQHFDDGHFAIERAVDRGKLHPDGSGADDHQRLGNLFQAENFDVGEHAIAGFEPGNHAGFRPGRQNHILGFEIEWPCHRS